MKSPLWARVSLTMFALSLCGCEPADFKVTKKPTYAELVVTYNAEVETLDHLEAKRNRIIADYFSQAHGNALKSAVGSLAGEQSSANPNEALDRAVAAAEFQAQLQSTLLEKAGQPAPTGSTSPADKLEYPEELKRQLVEIDAEITAQKARVERAKNARDANPPK